MRDASVLGVIGSARGDGNTHRLARAVFDRIENAHLADLGGFRIAPYRYDETYENDDFLTLAEAMTKARAIVFASPVYWYSMSAPMKVFFDRLTDLTGSQKRLGKSLAGKTMFLIASGGSAAPNAAFEPPFSETAGYFDMKYGGMLYAQSGAIDADRIADFAASIAAAAQSPAGAQEISRRNGPDSRPAL